MQPFPYGDKIQFNSIQFNSIQKADLCLSVAGCNHLCKPASAGSIGMYLSPSVSLVSFTRTSPAADSHGQSNPFCSPHFPQFYCVMYAFCINAIFMRQPKGMQIFSAIFPMRTFTQIFKILQWPSRALGMLYLTSNCVSMLILQKLCWFEFIATYVPPPLPFARCTS